MENIKLTEIKELIINTEKSKIYKSGIITEMYNKIFNKNEKPTNCGSCLRTFFLKIKSWYQDELTKQMEADKAKEQIIMEDEELIIDSSVELIGKNKEEVVEASPIQTDNDKPKSKGKKKK